MAIIKAIFTILGLILLFIGILIFVFELAGFVKYRYILNRMHAAGMGDTLGIFICLFGLVLICGFSFVSAKLLLVIAFLWFASPTASHLISRLEAVTDEEINKYVDVQTEGNLSEYLRKEDKDLTEILNEEEEEEDE
ncbi:MAG: monovalent cation/H(+) antiporter subunit G [Lachnospiraceae bacterium]|nr:monovalent cation/H(+) antiporter subunit G [Lachnospiraceae bacterium]